MLTTLWSGRRWRRLHRGVAGAMLGCVAISGCGLLGGGQTPKTPDNFARASTKQLSFSYPKSWEKSPSENHPEGWTAIYVRTVEGQNTAQVAVYTRMPPASDAEVGLEAFIATFQYTHNFERKKDRAITVQGAKSAWRIDYTYNAEAPEGQRGRLVRGTDVSVVDSTGNVAIIRITRYPKSVEDGVVQRIVDSIVVKSN